MTSPTARDLRITGNQIAWGLVVAGFWLWTFRQLAIAWRSYPNYGYGYAVPWIALYLAWRRIRAKPSNARVSRRGPSRALLFFCLLVAWCGFLLAELMRQTQPHWRLVSWLMIFAATLLTGVWIFQCGGSRLLKNLAFPLIFPWVAVPWPVQMETIVTLKLKTMVTAVTVWALNATGTFALQKVNVIELTSSSVGVDTACSGVTSLQSSLMVTLFLGEFFRLGRWLRVLLVVAGLSIAFGANCARVYALSVIADTGGPVALAKYHDFLGHAEAILIFVLTLIVARVIAAQAETPRRARETDPGALRRFLSGAAALRGGYATLAAFVAVPILVSSWFDFIHGGSSISSEQPRWSVKTNLAPPWQTAPVTISPDERKILLFTQGEAFSIGASAERPVTLYHFFWKSDEIPQPSIAPYGHTPDICMTYAGWQQRGGAVEVNLRVRDAEFASKLYHFERDGQEMAAFETVWFGREVANDLTRFGMMSKNTRGYGMEVIGLFMPTMSDQDAQIRVAEETLARVLASRIP